MARDTDFTSDSVAQLGDALDKLSDAFLIELAPILAGIAGCMVEIGEAMQPSIDRAIEDFRAYFPRFTIAERLDDSEVWLRVLLADRLCRVLPDWIAFPLLQFWPVTPRQVSCANATVGNAALVLSAVVLSAVFSIGLG